jgi:DNA polymerase sigma
MEAIFSLLECKIKEIFKAQKATVEAYGSYAQELMLPDSDLDICVCGIPLAEQS